MMTDEEYFAHATQLGEDFLEHYGVAGMKWGKHRAKADAYEIRSARARLQAKRHEYSQAKHEVRKTKRGSAERVAAKAHVAKIKSDFYKNPDRVTASRLTRGEKAIVALTGPLGWANIAATSAISRRIEQKQETGQYK